MQATSDTLPDRTVHHVRHIEAWPVSTRVNSTKNNDERLLDPLP